MALAPVIQPRQALSLVIDRDNPEVLPPSDDVREFVAGMESAARLDALYRDGWSIATGPIEEGRYVSFLLVRPLVEVPG